MKNYLGFYDPVMQARDGKFGNLKRHESLRLDLPLYLAAESIDHLPCLVFDDHGIDDFDDCLAVVFGE